MNITQENNKKRQNPVFFHRIVFRLWCMMMALVLLAAVFIWIAQVFLFEKSYVNNAITEITQRVEPLKAELAGTDIADNPQILTHLSMSVSGKMIVVNDKNELVEAYSMGYPIALATDSALLDSWCSIQEGEFYHFITDREAFQDTKKVSSTNVWLYIGIPVDYYGVDSYIVMMHPLSDVYSALTVNRQQLALFCVLLTVAASFFAALMSRRFTKPILKIKSTVDTLAGGDLSAVPDIRRNDELGQLSDSVRELGVALNRVDVLRKEVIANVSHELRTPLAHIGGYAEMARDVHESNGVKRKEDLDFIISETSRMTEMVNDIMDYSQLQSGYLPLKKDQYNLYEIVEAEICNCNKAALENHLSIEFKYDKKEYPVCLDALKITQVIRNLVYNAINHTKDGEVITVKLASDGSQLRLSVINPGEPIPKEERAIIWERYQRCQHQAGRQQGTGIGLSIVASILKAHNMTYGVDCYDGLTEFWFTADVG